MIIQLPFCGFYESMFSAAIDDEQEQFCNNEAEKLFSEYYELSEDLQITESEFSDIVYDCANYLLMYKHIASEYVPAFNEYIRSEFDIDLGLMFESMDR